MHARTYEYFWYIAKLIMNNKDFHYKAESMRTILQQNIRNNAWYVFLPTPQ